MTGLLRFFFQAKKNFRGCYALEVLTLPVGELAANCYILWAPPSSECVVIDPGCQGALILEKVHDLGLTVKAIVLTHGHFDHTEAAGYLQENTDAPVLIGRADRQLLWEPGWMSPYVDDSLPKVKNVTVIEEGDTVTFADMSMTVMETPGHSPGSISLYCPGYLFSGDLIFLRGVGRGDLPGGNARELSNSIHDKVMVLPPKTRIYPGHGRFTTVGYEKNHNPYI